MQSNRRARGLAGPRAAAHFPDRMFARLGQQIGTLTYAWVPVAPPYSRRREFCHFADAPSPSTLKRLLKKEEGAAEGQSRRRLAPPSCSSRLVAAIGPRGASSRSFNSMSWSSCPNRPSNVQGFTAVSKKNSPPSPPTPLQALRLFEVGGWRRRRKRGVGSGAVQAC